MNQFLRFYLGLCFGAILGFVVYLAVLYSQFGVPTRLSWRINGIIQRKLDVADVAPRPRLLVVAGSSAFYGISARTIEAKLGISTINLGTHAALGTSYILDLARRAAEPGDTILLALEYDQYNYGNDSMRKWVSIMFLDYVMAHDPEYWRRLPIRDQLTLSLLVPHRRLREGLWNRWNEPNFAGFEKSPVAVYDARALDRYGDTSGHGVDNVPANVPRVLNPVALNHRILSSGSGFKDLRTFCVWAETNRIRLLATFPNMTYRPEVHDTPVARASVDTITQFYIDQGIPVIGTAREAMFPRSEFFDTSYHMTAEGSQARSLRLAEKLKPYFHKVE